MTELVVDVEGVGGIDQMECRFTGDVGVITGPNSSNKTSLVQAIAFALGRSTVPIKNGSEEARVELTLDGRTVVRTARETAGGIQIGGEPWLEDEGDVDLFERFACLLEFSEIRAAVRNDDDFETVLKGPMDIDALERERAEKVAHKNDLEEEIDANEDIEDRIEKRTAKLAEKEAHAEKLEARLETLRAEQRELTDDDEIDALQAERSRITATRQEYLREIDDFEEAIDRLGARIDDVDAELDGAREAVSEYDLESLRAERESIQQALHDATDRLEVLQSVLTANREMLSSSVGSLGRERDLAGDTVTCWACGEAVEETAFERTIADLTDLIESEKERRSAHQPRLQEIDDRIHSVEEANRRVAQLESKKRSLEEQRESRRESLDTKRERLKEIEAELEALDEKLSAKETKQESESSDLTGEIESTRIDLHTTRNDIDRIAEAIDELESRRRERERNCQRVETLREEIRSLTDRIETLEQRLRGEFNTAMDELIELLEYQNVERVWLDGNYELIVAREADGVTRQDRVQNLSESEREMVGLVLALAGYLAHDVADAVPVLLIDTLGAFDADRTSSLLDYFATESPFLLTTLLPDSEVALARSDLEYDPINPARLTV